MIRAGRAHLVRTLADLAVAEGKSPKTFSNRKLHRVPGHPEPISSPSARVLLWDGEQVDAYREGRVVPVLPVEESAEDLLDRNEAAELAGVEPRTWDRYANLPGMRPRPEPVVVAGIEHWRRGDVRDYCDSRPGPGSSPGRPAGRRDAAPRTAVPVIATEVLEREPAITAARLSAALGVSAGTAQRALAQARAAAVGRLLVEKPDLTVADVRDRLGYPSWAAERALAAAHGRRKAAGPESP